MHKFARNRVVVVLAAGSMMASGLALTGLAPAATAAGATSVGADASAFAVPEPVTGLRAVPRLGEYLDVYFNEFRNSGPDSAEFLRIEVRDPDGYLVRSVDYRGYMLRTSLFDLPTDQTLDISVTAWNSQGGSEATTVSTYIPTDPPRPQDVTATPGDHSATVRWSVSAPTAPNVEITGFRVRGGGGEVVLPASARSLTKTGLRNGQSYRFNVATLTAYGRSDQVGADVTPAGPPGRPRDVRAATQGRTIVVRWSTATIANGSPIKNYRVAVAGKTVTVRSRLDFAKVRNVRPGSYRATVRAINGVGASKAATTNGVRVKK